jgi:hypothetical protein
MTCERTESLSLVAFWLDREAPEWAELRDHYPRCEDCSEAVAVLSELVADLATRATASAHPEVELMLDFVIARSSLSAGEQARIDRHMSHCASCRDEVRVVRGFDYSALPQPARAEASEPEAEPSGLWSWLGGLTAGRPAWAFVATSAVAVVLGLTLAQFIPEPRERGRSAARPYPVAQPKPPASSLTMPGAQPITPAPAPGTSASSPSLQLAEAEPPPRVDAGAAPDPIVPLPVVAEPAPERVARAEPQPKPAKPSPELSKPASQELLLAANLPAYVPSYAMNAALLGDDFGAARLHTVVRGRAAKLPIVRVLAPPHVGATASASPTLYWFLSDSSSAPVEIVLIDDTSIEPLIEVRLDPPIAAGLHALDLALQGVSLQPSVSYRWLVALVPDEANRESDQVAAAGIRWTPPDADTERRLDEGPALERAHRQAQLGYWYDAFATVEAWRTAEPASRRLVEYEAALLEQVDLPELAEALR